MSSCLVRVVIPMKPLARSKQRLADVLDAKQRAALSLWMLERVARAAADSKTVEEVAVLGGDAPVQALCRRLGLRWCPDAEGELNAALNRFYRASSEGPWCALLYLAADLPGLETADVDALLAALDGADLVLAPGARGGTNALLIRCRQAFEFQLGEESFRRHEAQAVAQGLRHHRVARWSLELDVDVPDDLARLRQAAVLRDMDQRGLLSDGPTVAWL